MGRNLTELVLGDIASVAIAIILVALIRQRPILSGSGLSTVFIATVGAMYVAGLYDHDSLRSRLKWLIATLFAMLLATAACMSLWFIAPSLILHKRSFLMSMATATGLLAMWRSIAVSLLPNEPVRILLALGESQDRDPAEKIAESKRVTIASTVVLPVNQSCQTQLDELRSTYYSDKADVVVIGRSVQMTDDIAEALLVLRCRGAVVLDCADAFELFLDYLDLDSLTPEWMAVSSRLVGAGMGSSFDRIKRASDVVAAIVGLVFAIPIVALAAMLIRLETTGPVFYGQIRVGLQGQLFRIFKLRTMTVDAESSGAQWARQNDPRVTRVGRILRMIRLDELPQLFNVLRGEMSMVGPRPERPEFVRDLETSIPYYSLRHMVKPGVTGWAQVCYPYGRTVSDARRKLEYDLYYIRNQSPLLEMKILARTVRVVVSGFSANT